MAGHGLHPGMFFKDELPPPRYALDGDVADAELPQTTEFRLEVHVPSLAGHDLLLLAPRCATVLGALDDELGHAEVHCVTRAKAERTVQGLYETEADESDFSASHTYRIAVHRLRGGAPAQAPAAVAVLPAMPEAEAAFTGAKLVPALAPARVVLVTPGQSFMDAPVCYLATSESAAAGLKQARIPRAQPPVLVQGAGAACVSRAQQLGTPALALVLSSDGPPNYEIVATGSAELASEALVAIFGRQIGHRGVERGVSELYV